MECLTQIRVRYAETDAMGIVHHATYPVWMELGRSDFLRELGMPYPEWERRGVLMGVAELKVKYRQSARYDEAIQVYTRLVEAGRRKVVFAYRIEREGVRLVEGETVHLVMGPDGRASTVPGDLLDLVRPVVWPQP